MDTTIPESAEVFDLDAAADEQMVAHGYSKEKHGQVVADDQGLKDKVYSLAVKRIVSSKEEKSKKSWTEGELYAAVFPEGPGADKRVNKDLLSEEERLLMEKLARKAWNLLNPGRSGYVQKRLGQEDGGNLVLCRAPVYRGQDTVQGSFVTDNDDLILNDSLQPQIESLVKKADTLRQHADMIGDRRPSLEGRMKVALGLGVKRTVAALPAVSDSETKDTE